MRYIAINHTSSKGKERRELLPPEWEVFKTSDPTPITYHNVAAKAVEERWGLDVVVLQDDVRFKFDVDGISSGLIVYGQRTGRRPLHICPRAFAASPQVWKLLVKAWDGIPEENTRGQICRQWLPIVMEHGRVVDNTLHGIYEVLE